jgi:hypothetical protein
VAERTQTLVGQPAFYDLKNSGDFLAAAERFFFGQLVAVFGLGNAVNFEFTALEALHIGAVLHRGDQLVLAAAHEIEKVFEELSDLGGSDVVLEVQLADALAQEDVEVDLIEDLKTAIMPFQ